MSRLVEDHAPLHKLAKYARVHPEVDLNPDDYSKFSQEAMKYVEKHF